MNSWEPLLEASLREVFTSGEMVGDPAFACRMTGEYLAFNTDGFAPVLGRITDDHRFEPVPLLEVGAPLHHVVLPLPSGVLLAADWFRLPGFKEALETVEEPDAPEITSAAGREARARAYLEGFGLGIVQTGNCAPHFWRDGEAWRVGRLDEDHEAYWDDAPGGPRPLPPQDGWVICDLWAVTFGDREVVLDVLEAGGHYGSRAAAAEALDGYCAEHTTTRIQMEPGELHLYAPRGLGRHVTEEHFRSPDLADWPGMEDLFILSKRPLAFGDSLVVETGWRAPALSAAVEVPAP